MSNRRLSATIVVGGTISSSLKAAMGSTQSGLQRIGSEITAVNKRQVLLGKSIQTFGRMGKDVSGLRSEYAKTVATIDRMRAAQERLNKAQERYKSLRAAADGFGGAAMKAGVAAAAIGVAGYAGIHKAIDRENAVNVIRNSGVSKQEADSMIGAAARSKQFGVSVTRATETVSELRTALGDAHHAIEALPSTMKAISGLQLYNRGHKTQIGEDAAYSLAKIAEERGGASSPEALREKQNWAFKALTGSNGVVTADDQLTAIRRGKSAVAAMSDRAFFGDTFLMQAMGANGYGTASSTLVNAWIGGHQTHGAFDEMMKLGLLQKSIGGKRQIEFDKTGKVKKVSSSALIDNELFLKDPQAWVDKYLIPLAQKRGVDVNDPAQIAKFANSIASNTNAANIISQRIRFSHNIAKDRHNVDIANGVDASDKANQASTAGKVDNARARMEDAQARMGTVLLPMFASAMEKGANALERLNGFMERNPVMAKGIIVGLAGVAGSLAVVAPIALTVGHALSSYAGYRLVMEKLGAATGRSVGMFNAMRSVVRGAGAAIGFTFRIARMLGGRAIVGGIRLLAGAMGIARTAILVMGRAMMANPVLAIVGLIAGAALLIWQNWDTLGPKFKKLWGGIKDEFQSVLDWFKTKFQWVGDAWAKTKEFLGVGQDEKAQPQLPPPGSPAARMPSLPEPKSAAAGKGAAPVADNRQYHVTIHQQPGQSSKDVANDVTKKLGAPASSRLGSGLYDVGL
ncbi:hypothetical protein [Burkholderia pyrrocinia]|uniref:hypothetical protein n=1 Tax=Burkholderia pyrrocinia TaxID=60550 RepID=UPI00158AB136|nr:hypothetical protein [Burkholderia pyrrocinia]